MDESSNHPSDLTGVVHARKQGFFADPFVRKLSWVGAVLLIAFLAAVVSALFFGIINPPAPRTALERQISLAETQIDAGSADPLVWHSYISGLITAKQYPKAERMIERALEAGYEDPAKQYLYLAQVQLDLAREDYELALEDSDEAIRALKAQLELEERIFEGTKSPTIMIAEGLGQSYETLLLNRAEAFEELGRVDEAIESLDSYLEKNTRAADVLVWRGDVKSAAGYTDGAIADYREASTYMPGDEELLEKLSGLGATNE